jgi:hypothetical protein
MSESSDPELAPACRAGNVFACAKFPECAALLASALPPHDGLVDAISPDQIFIPKMLQDFRAAIGDNLTGTTGRRRSFNQAEQT